MSRDGYTEIDGYTALFCEIEDIPIQHYSSKFYITEENLKAIAGIMLANQVIKLKPTQEYLRECCRFRS